MPQNAEELLRKYREDTCTPQERELVERYFDQRVVDDDRLPHPGAIEAAHQRLEIAFRPLTRKTRLKRAAIRLSAAATLLIMAGAGYYFLRTVPAPPRAIAAQDVHPGQSRARLILSGGRSVELEQIHPGVIANERGSTVRQTGDGQLVYAAAPKDTSDAGITYNTLIVPKGGEYRLVLSDGTTVHLNAASSLRYPIRFDGPDRRVELTGEGYFEVAKDPRKPFVVHTAAQDVQVLGTHFNVRAYDRGQCVTTLAEGAVLATLPGERQGSRLTPGQQVSVVDGELKVGPADMETALAWVNGRIYFKDASLKQVLAEAARWYDLDVKYEGNVRNEPITGGIRRTASLASLLKILALSGVHVKITQTAAGKQLTVYDQLTEVKP